jgi:Effector Associated Constant Component 1
MAAPRIEVLGWIDSDDEERAKLSRLLRGELLRLPDIAHVEHERSSQASHGAKAGEVLEWATLVVELAGGLSGLVAALRSWTRRNEGVTIRLSLDGDELEIREPSTEERAALVDSWLRSHES